MNEIVGVQTSLSYFKNEYLLGSVAVSNGGSARVTPGYIVLPILAKLYPGDSRQFCWFGGIQLGYLLGGAARFRSTQNIEPKNLVEIVEQKKEFDNSPAVDLTDIKEQDKVQKLLVGMVVGFDYTFEFGLILGLSYAQSFTDVIEADKSSGTWSLQPVLGYNFGIFL